MSFDGYSLIKGNGNAVAGQDDYLWTPDNPLPGAPCVVLCHPHQGVPYDAFAGVATPSSTKVAAALAAAGFVVIGGDMAGDNWGNDAGLATIPQMIAYAASKTGCPTSHSFLGAQSMGGIAMVRYAAANPAKVLGCFGLLPATNVKWIYDNNVNGAAAAIATAWGGAPADVQALAAPLIKAGKVPGWTFYSTADLSVRPVDSTGFATAAGWQASAIDATLGHVDGSVAKIPTDRLVAWLKTLA